MMEFNLWLLRFGFLISLQFCVFCQAEDGYGTWHRTLTPFQAHACDGDELHLQCTPHTVISVHYVLYGRQRGLGHLCPSGDRASSNLDGQCDSSRGALQVIHRHCHKSMMCRLHVTPSLFGTDNCPGVRKYVEVVYKCRPEEFLNKIVCQGGLMEVSCPPGQGLTVYSATYGTTRAGAPECGRPEEAVTASGADCLIDHADETIRSLCSGRQNCSLIADDRTFGNPGCEGTKYLKIAYNCVEKELLLSTLRRSADETIQTTSFPAWARGIDQSAHQDSRPRSSSTVVKNKAEMQSDEVPTTGDIKRETLDGDQELVGFMSNWMAAHRHMTGNKDKLILYVSISLTVGFIAFITVLGGRFVITRLESRRSSKLEVPTDAEDQFFSESDLDHFDHLDHIVPIPPPPPPVIATVHHATLTRSATVARKDSDVLPRTPVNTGTELDHYFS